MTSTSQPLEAGAEILKRSGVFKGFVVYDTHQEVFDDPVGKITGITSGHLYYGPYDQANFMIVLEKATSKEADIVGKFIEQKYGTLIRDNDDTFNVERSQAGKYVAAIIFYKTFDEMPGNLANPDVLNALRQMRQIGLELGGTELPYVTPRVFSNPAEIAAAAIPKAARPSFREDPILATKAWIRAALGSGS